jgi:hypothetical protein
MLKRMTALFCFAMLFAIFPARADEWNNKTIVTFSQPVELPGVVLPSGTYVFKLLNSLSNRHIVQVFNADETKILTTILAIPNYRLTPSGETVLRFDERPKEQPEALRAWFYPGDNFGQEFVYPKPRAMRLAEITGQPVLSREAKPIETPEELKSATVVAIAPARKAPEMAAPPTRPSVEADRTAPVPELPRPIPELPVGKLPDTASPLPLVALAGILSLGVARLLNGRR